MQELMDAQERREEAKRQYPIISRVASVEVPFMWEGKQYIAHFNGLAYRGDTRRLETWEVGMEHILCRVYMTGERITHVQGDFAREFGEIAAKSVGLM